MVTPPPVAITVARYDPPATLAPTFTVSVLEPAPGALIDVADSVAVIPCGSPLTAKVTAELKELLRAVATVAEALAPAAMSRYAAEIVRASGGVLTTVSASGKDRVVPPFVAETVRV